MDGLGRGYTETIYGLLTYLLSHPDPPSKVCCRLQCSGELHYMDTLGEAGKARAHFAYSLCRLWRAVYNQLFLVWQCILICKRTWSLLRG